MEHANRIVNLCPHPILVTGLAGGDVTLHPEPVSARVTQQSVHVGASEQGIALFETRYGETTGLPDPTPGTVYVVSALVAAANRHRRDLFCPNDLVRDGSGNVVGCRSLARPA
jgi:hypothetical protein